METSSYLANINLSSIRNIVHNTAIASGLIPLMTNGFMAEEAVWNLKPVRAQKCGERFIIDPCGAALCKGEEIV